MYPPAEEVRPRSVRSARILLVDDEQRVLRFVCRGLQDEGYAVDAADNGADGLRMALTGAYDLIILDLLMPGLDGRTVLRRIVRKLPLQPVMILSCLTETAAKVSCFEAGAEDYLAKPFSLDELLARVRAHLRVAARRSATTRLSVAWVGFAIANLVGMWLLPTWETVPFHFIWVSLTLVYGFFFNDTATTE